MAIRVYKPITNGTRQRSVLKSDEITKTTPEKSLVVKLNKTDGRNNQGKITVRHRGGGVKRKYRLIDFKRNKDGIPALVASIEYDPNRSANIALLNYKDGEKKYIIAPKGLEVGNVVESGEMVDIKVGNAMPIMNIPVGTTIHNIEMKPGKGAQIARSAGASAQILGREDKYVLIRLSSGETRKILSAASPLTVAVITTFLIMVVLLGVNVMPELTATRSPFDNPFATYFVPISTVKSSSMSAATTRTSFPSESFVSTSVSVPLVSYPAVHSKLSIVGTASLVRSRLPRSRNARCSFPSVKAAITVPSGALI